MAKEKYENKKIGEDRLGIIETVNSILDDYGAQGYRLNLRQIYYQFVSMDWFPDDRKFSWNGSKWVPDRNGTKNATPNYKWLVSIVGDGRNVGLIDWAMIEDMVREVQYASHWRDPSHIVQAAAEQFRVDHWEGQENYVEVMCEKAALAGIIGPVCDELDVRFTPNRGFSSLTALYDAGKRFAAARQRGARRLYVLYLGDHDPSGVDMTRDVLRRIRLYSRLPSSVEMRRLALNLDQVRLWNPPPNPAKMTDSRGPGYVAEFGASSWELDSVRPEILAGLVRDGIQGLISNVTLWNEIIERERTMRDELQEFVTDYADRHNGSEPDEEDEE